MADTKESEKTKTMEYWVGQIDAYERKFSPWEKRGKKIIDRYRDERESTTTKRAQRFNILWSNVQTLQPALYNSPPKPNVDRRWQEDDDLGRYAALALERSATYFVNDKFDEVVKKVVLDRLLPGRGVPWVRYEPTFSKTEQVTEDPEGADELVDEKICLDYVNWKDFGHTLAATWEEVRAPWRKVKMNKKRLKDRWPKDYKKIPMDEIEDGKEGTEATIYEIWDSHERKAIWLHKSMDDIIEEMDDPLKLQGFFPCPRPLYATLTNEDLIPSPDYTQYQDQAAELDTLTGRIGLLQKAIKVAGVYDASAEGIDRLLNEGVENKLIPVDGWAKFGDKGLAGVISFFPLGEILQALTALYEARDKVKQDLYEITGISDIIRGASDPNETLGAQELKGKYAGLRLDDKQKEVASMCRDLVRIITEIIAEHFSIDTIKQISGLKLMTEQEKRQVQGIQQMQTQYQQQAQQMQQAGQQSPPSPQLPEITDEQLEMLDLPSWEQIEQLIKSDSARSFRIDIETDSTIKTDQESDKKERIEYITAMGGFIQQAVQVPDPALKPLLMQMLMFASRGFKIGREFETELDATMNDIKKQQKEPQQPQPDPDIEKAKMEAQTKQAELQQQGQIEDAKMKSQERVDLAKVNSSIQIEEIKEKVRQEAETRRFAMELASKERIEVIKQQGESMRHTEALQSQPAPVEEVA